MPLIALASLKSSPGVTTTALALAAAWPAPRRLLLEADPAGGDLGPWLDLPPSPGLVGLAAAARHDHDDGTIWDHAQLVGDGMHVVVAPAGADQASACVGTFTGTGMTSQLSREPEVVVADCGRLDPGSPALGIAAQAHLTLLLVRPQVSDLSHVAPRIGGLLEAGLRLALLLAPADGRVPAEPAYSAQEITATLGFPVHGTIPADPRSVAHLIARRGAPGATTRRRPLTQMAATLATRLAGQQASEPPPETFSDAIPPERDLTPAEAAASDQHS